MLNLNDLFQWERFITPSIIRIFYALMLGITALLGLSGLASAIAMMKNDLLQGLVMLIATCIGTVAAVLFVRIATEFVLMVFRMNEHLAAIRNNRGEL